MSLAVSCGRRLVAAILLLGFSILYPSAVYATVQERQQLTLRSETGSIWENPLGPVLAERRARFEMRSTGNYAGYTASWEVSGGKLQLIEFVGRVRGKDQGLSWLFRNGKPPIFAGWFTGTIHVDLGEIRLSKGFGHVVATDRLVVLSFERGLLTKESVYRYPRNLPLINARESRTLGRKYDIRKEEY